MNIVLYDSIVLIHKNPQKEVHIKFTHLYGNKSNLHTILFRICSKVFGLAVCVSILTLTFCIFRCSFLQKYEESRENFNVTQIEYKCYY